MPRKFISDEERTVVEAEQVRAFFNEANDQNVAGALVLSLIVYVVHEGIPAWTWQPALAALYAVTLVRAWLIRCYRRAPASRSTRAWGRGQAIGGTVAGVCWGAANTAMLAHVPTESQFFILTVMTVSAAASAAEGFSFPPPSRGFILASLSPAIVWLLTVGDRLHYVLAVMLAIFVPMTLWQALKRNRIFIEAQQLRFRNEVLANELTMQRDAAEQAYLAKARFLAAASHDLRQPMQALSIFHELLQSEAQTVRGGEHLANAQRAGEAMNMLLDTLLDVSKLDARVIKPDCQAFPVQALLAEMEREFVPVAEQKGIRLDVRPCPAGIVSDPVLLGRVLRNLLSNAIRYTPSGRVLVGCRRRQGRLAIAVLDTGIGIAPANQAAIFTEFFQVDNQARDRKQGLGLGLAIVERITRLLDHPLSLRSQPGRGSCFVVTVPLATASASPAPPRPAAELVRLPDRLAGRRIAVIDDEEAIRTGMAELMHGWGCEVTAAGSVAECLRLVGHGRVPIDGLISDMGLPGPDNGIGAIAAFRKLYGDDFPALLVTGDTSRAALRAAEAEQLIMLHKPIKPARLRAALTEALGPGRYADRHQSNTGSHRHPGDDS
ncbi:MAG: hybrid sensor histidine kinase/response regulator [Rhodocyclales bacterium]|nr:hybrid sensor histidine kinase/response regulator [Rhodocyclales bacterium]